MINKLNRSDWLVIFLEKFLVSFFQINYLSKFVENFRFWNHFRQFNIVFLFLNTIFRHFFTYFFFFVFFYWLFISLLFFWIFCCLLFFFFYEYYIFSFFFFTLGDIIKLWFWIWLKLRWQSLKFFFYSCWHFIPNFYTVIRFVFWVLLFIWIFLESTSWSFNNINLRRSQLERFVYLLIDCGFKHA